MFMLFLVGVWGVKVRGGDVGGAHHGVAIVRVSSRVRDSPSLTHTPYWK